MLPLHLALGKTLLTLDLRVRDVIAHVVEGDDEAVTTWKITCLGELC